jgi:YD repeat-containing protein
MDKSKAAFNSERMVVHSNGSSFIPPYANYARAARTFLSCVGIAILFFYGNAAIPQAFAATNKYVYDDADRLVGVIDATGASALYTYDALGNIVSIARTGATSVSVLGFTPYSGSGGTVVTISGTGFGATPSQNTVKFNDLAAAVTSATSTSLKVLVPAGVTTGKISVTTPAGTATSAVNFVVNVASAAPTISGFSPALGTAGMPVIITGTNFGTANTANKVAFNQKIANVSTSAATSLGVVVPENMESGKISVSTVYGTAISAVDFIFVPPAITLADIINTVRIAAYGSATVLNIDTANKTGLLYFDGIAGNYLTLNITAATNASGYNPVYYQIYTPQNKLHFSGIVEKTGSVHLPVLPTSGIYSIYFTPTDITTSITSELTVDDWIALDGVSLNEPIQAPYDLNTSSGQTVRMIFKGTAGQSVGIGITNLVTSPSDAYSILSVNASGLSYYAIGCLAYEGGCVLHAENLPVTDTFEVIFSPNLITFDPGSTGSFTATLSSDITGVLSLGNAFDLNMARPGQCAVLSFNGVAGQYLTLTFSPVSLVGPASSWTKGRAYVNAPSGSFAYALFDDGADTVLTLPPLPETGTYSIVIAQPSGATSARMNVKLTQ